MERSTYLETLDQFLKVSREPRGTLAEYVARRVIEFGKRHEIGHVNLLDVGSSDGSLLRDVLSFLADESLSTTVVALEPDAASFAALQGNGDLVRHGVRAEQVSFEDYIARRDANRSVYDVVLLTHVLYHVVQPTVLLEALRERTARPALLVASLDSHDGLIYRLADRIRSLDELPETTQWGSYIGAETLRDELATAGFISHEIEHWSELHFESWSEVASLAAFLGRRVAGSPSAEEMIRAEASSLGLELPTICDFRQIVFDVELR